MRVSRELEEKILAMSGEKPAAAKPKQKRKPREVATGGKARWSITLVPACRVVTEANTTEHWTLGLKRKKAQQEALTIAVHGAGWGVLWHTAPWHKDAVLWRPPVPCVIRFTHIGPRMDDDNLQRAFKALRDAVAFWLRVDDGDARVTWKYTQKPGKPGVVITIEGKA